MFLDFYNTSWFVILAVPGILEVVCLTVF